jgi:hypothetical protein
MHLILLVTMLPDPQQFIIQIIKGDKIKLVPQIIIIMKDYN